MVLQELQGQGNFGLSAPKREPKQLSPTSDMSKYGTVKKSFNRYLPILSVMLYINS